MVTVPFGLACAVFALMLTGGSLNVYSEIGLVLLVGIMAKNGILVVEFANQLRDRGIERARRPSKKPSRIRLRPIMMTKLVDHPRRACRWCWRTAPGRRRARRSAG